MKKNVKNTVIATSILLALAGSFMGCQQTVAPTPVDTTKTNKDVFEQQLGNSVMKAESLFGKNVVYFSDVNYANNYVLYRFGPMDDPLKGTNISIADSKNNTGFDGFVVYDTVSPTNYMEPGNYTYKLVAKSDVNSARTATVPETPNLNKDEKAPANQGYWANPKVDIVYLPSLAEVSVNVPKENMPTYKTQLSLKKEEVKYVKYTDAEKIVHWKLVPGANKDGVTIFAQYEDDINKLVIESKKENSSADKGYVDDKKDSDSDITIPESSALKGKWNVYALWTCPSDFSNYYKDSEKVLLDTIEVDAPYPTANFLVKSTKVNAAGKNKAKYGLTWDVKTEVADMYTFSAKRAVIETRKAPDVSDNTSNAVPIVTPNDKTPNDKLIKVYKDLTNVTFTAPVKTVNDDTTTFTVYDESVKQGEKYVYFWTFTPKDAKYNKVTGATELSENITLADEVKKLQLTTVTNETAVAKVNAKTDKEFASYSIKFTSKIESVSEKDGAEQKPENIAYDRYSVKSVKRIAYNKDTKKVGESTNDLVFDYFYDYKNKYSVVSVVDSKIPFEEDNKDVTKYGYAATIEDKMTGKTFDIENIYTDKDDNKNLKYVTPISKLRYTYTVTVKDIKNVKENSLDAIVTIALSEKSELYGTESGVDLSTKAIPSIKVPAINYVIKDSNNTLFVADGKTKDITLENGKDNTVSISLGKIKLQPDEQYKLFINGTDITDSGKEFSYTKK